MKAVVLFFLLSAGINLLFSNHLKLAEKIHPSIFEVKIERSHMADFWLLLLGSRRAAADFAWLRLMQYYGTHFEDEENEEEAGHTEEEHQGHVHMFEGKYNDLKFRSNAVLKLDPYFKYAYIYAAGALAFNHERQEEALEILHFGIKHLPKYWKLPSLMAAISYREKKDIKRTVETLSMWLDDPETPVMLKNILALLYEKLGDYEGAKRAWEIIAESADEGYVERAKKHLALIKKNSTL